MAPLPPWHRPGLGTAPVTLPFKPPFRMIALRCPCPPVPLSSGPRVPSSAPRCRCNAPLLTFAARSGPGIVKQVPPAAPDTLPSGHRTALSIALFMISPAPDIRMTAS